MKLSIAVYIAATTALSVSAFAPMSFNRRSITPLRVSSAPKETAAIDLAADFEAVGPEDVLSGAKVGQAEVVLVGCGAPNRGMGWYHAIQMLEGR